MTISEADYQAALSQALADADEIERTQEAIGFRLTRSDIRLIVLARELRRLRQIALT